MNTIVDIPEFDLASSSVSAFIDENHDTAITSHELQFDEKGAATTNLIKLIKGNSHVYTCASISSFIAEKSPTILRQNEKKTTAKPLTYSDVRRVWEENACAKRTRVQLTDIPTSNKSSSSLSADCFYGNEATNAFAIHNLLSPVECEYIIATAEPHMDPLDHLYAQKTRKADRAMIRSSVVAGQLFRRILPLLKREKDYAMRSPLCFGHDGVWVPLGLNECLKVFRYTPGGVFVPHRDGPWVPRQDQCSMYTVVIYLNDDFLGGSTLLAGSEDHCGPQGIRTYNWERSSLINMVPIQGSALLFNHDCWHAGHPVESGTKWILRTELIFQRVHSFYVDKNAFASEGLYREARELYDASMSASAAGDRDAFFDKYQQVVRMQRAAMLREEACRAAMLLPRLGLEELSGVLSFLPLREVGQLMRVNRRTYCAIRQAPLWQDLWAADVRRGGVPVPAAVVDDRREHAMLAPVAAISLALCGGGRPLDASDPSQHHGHGDYFGLYRQRVWMRRQFTPAALLLLDSGAVMATPVPLLKRPDNERRYEAAYRPTFTPMGLLDVCYSLAANGSPALNTKMGKYEVFCTMRAAAESARGFGLARARRYYGNWLYAYPYHMNQPSGERLTTSDQRGHLEGASAKPIVDPTSGVVEWSVLCTVVDEYVETADTPLIVVTHPTWHLRDLIPPIGDTQKTQTPDLNTDGLMPKCQAAADALFELCSVPAVGFCHPAVCAAIGCGTACPDVTPHDGGCVLTIEMRYGYTLSETTGLPLPQPLPADVVRYVYRVDTETMAVVGGVCVRGDGAVPEGFVVDVVLVDCNAEEPPEPRWGIAPALCSDEDLAARDSPMLATAKAAAEPQGQRVHALAEILGHGARAVSACPALCGCLLFRVPTS